MKGEKLKYYMEALLWIIYGNFREKVQPAGERKITARAE